MFIKPEGTIKFYDLDTYVYEGRSPLFTSKRNQETYFNKHVKLTVDKCKYIRHNGRVRVNIDAKDAFKVGYMSFTNKNYENTTFYAFLGEPVYINDQCFEYPWTLDPVQTWMFDVIIEKDFMLGREHLCSKDKTTAQNNKYTKDVDQLFTPEPLVVDESVQKIYYNIGKFNDSYSDGNWLMDEGGNTFTILYLADIDFNNIALPEGYEGDTPKVIFDKFKSALIGTSGVAGGFYYSPDDNKWHVNTSISSTQIAYTFTSFNSQVWVFGFSNVFDENNTPFTKLNELIQYLTFWGCTSAILGMYCVPYSFIYNNTFKTTNDPTVLPTRCRQRINPPSLPSGVTSFKLWRMPYTFTSVNAPDGTGKELYFEKFKDIAEGNSDSCEVAIILDLTGTPAIRVYPVNYINSFAGEALDIDMLNEFTFDKIPLTPYNIDAYISQYSAYAQQWLSQSSTIRRNELEMAYNTLGVQHTTSGWRGVQGINSDVQNIAQIDHNRIEYRDSVDVKGLRGMERAKKLDRAMGQAVSDTDIALGGSISSLAASAVNAGISMVESGLNTPLQKDTLNLQHQLVTGEAALALTGAGLSDALMTMYKGTLPPAVVNYYKGSLNPYTIYGLMSFFNLYSKNYQLREDVYKLYDNFFKLYGYNSRRVGRPFFANYIHSYSDTTTDNKPTWESDGNGHKVTYIQATQGHISGVPMYVAKFWEGILANGMTFVKGDELT